MALSSLLGVVAFGDKQKGLPVQPLARLRFRVHKERQWLLPSFAAGTRVVTVSLRRPGRVDSLVRTSSGRMARSRAMGPSAGPRRAVFALSKKRVPKSSIKSESERK